MNETTKTTIPPEMAELMQKTIEAHFAAYWTAHATPEQEAKREAEGKSFKGAAAFVRSVAEAYKKGKSCVAMPDEVAYWLLMEYMENQPEGATYGKPPPEPKEAKAAKAPAPSPATESRRRIAAKMDEMQLKLF